MRARRTRKIPRSVMHHAFRVLKKHDIFRALSCRISGKRCAQRSNVHRRTASDAIFKTSLSCERKAEMAALRKNLNNFVSSPEFGYLDQDCHKFREGHTQVLCAMSRRSSSDPGGKSHSTLGHNSLKDLLSTPELYSSPGLLGGDSKYAHPFFVPQTVVNPHRNEQLNTGRT